MPNSTKTTLFISDLHLARPDSALFDLLLALLNSELIQSAERLFILGDLFDFWVGADINPALDQALLTALDKLKGVQIYFMPGNRDFLIPKSFFQKIGGQLLPDPYRFDLYGVPTVLTHGDLLCTQDVAYQRFRKIVRFPLTQCIFRCLPKNIRENMAKKARMKSKAYQGSVDKTILDVPVASAEDFMQQHQVKQVIHGHVHRPKIHQHQQGAKRVVLGDWHQVASVIISSPGQIQLARYCAQSGIDIIDGYDPRTLL